MCMCVELGQPSRRQQGAVSAEPRQQNPARFTGEPQGSMRLHRTTSVPKKTPCWPADGPLSWSEEPVFDMIRQFHQLYQETALQFLIVSNSSLSDTKRVKKNTSYYSNVLSLPIQIYDSSKTKLHRFVMHMYNTEELFKLRLASKNFFIFSSSELVFVPFGVTGLPGPTQPLVVKAGDTLDSQPICCRVTNPINL